MRSVKMTQTLRDHICDDIIRRRFGDDFVAAHQKMAEFAAKVYRAVYSQHDRDLMSALPTGWLPQARMIKVQFGSDYTALLMCGGFYGSLNQARPTGFAITYPELTIPVRDDGRCLAVFDAESSLSVEFGRLRADIAAASRAVDEATRQIKVIINRASTTAQLVQAWPEAAPFVQPYVAERSRPAILPPAIPISGLNALLKLPAEADAQPDAN